MTYQREFAQTINVAIVGVGKHCYRNILPAMNYLPVKIKAICDVNEELAQITAAQYGNCAYYTNVKDMYKEEKLDAVILCVHATLHPQLAIEAFNAGLHVWLEKPVSMRAYEVEEMIVARKDKVAVVGFKKAFMPSTDKVVEIVKSEQFTELKSMLAIYPMSIPDNGEEVLEQRIFTNWLANGVHPLSLMLEVGGKVKAVTTHHYMNKAGICLVEFADGVIGNFHFASGPHPNESYHFYGEDWHIEVENSSKVTLQRGIPFEYNKTFQYIPEGLDSGAIVWEPQNCLATLENKALFTQGIYQELKHFCDCVIDHQQPQKGSLEFALEVMRVYEAALLSNGQRILIE